MIIVTHDIDEAIYLGSRVVVMSPRPGRIKKIQTVDLGTPRRRTGPLFTQARDAIYKEFFKEVELPIEYNI
jgi:sulfonate transport system ATP-binding protein